MMNKSSRTTPKSRVQKEKPLLCIECPHARFPGPNEQCYKFGGLICTRFQINVGKYDRCCEAQQKDR